MSVILKIESHVKVAVLVSLFLQSLLLLLSTFRKRTSNSFLCNSIFVIYLFSTNVASATLYFIAGVRYFTLSKMPIGLWATIVLLHLSGQERLTVFSSDEIGLWRMSTFNIVWQILIHLGLFSLQKDFMHVPSWIMLCLATYRIILRICRLIMGTEGMMLFFSFLSVDPDIIPQELTIDNDKDSQKVQLGHQLLKTSLHLFADSKCKPELLNEVRQAFLNIKDPDHAIRLIEIELNFIYESFHTDGTIRKHLNHCCSIMYTFLRCAEPLLCVIALNFYLAHSSNHVKSPQNSEDDYFVTNLLLWGTILLESISYIMTFFSDWTIAAWCSFHAPSGNALFQAVPQRHRWWSARYHPFYQNARLWVKFTRNLFRRWSETIFTFNLLSYSIKTRVPSHRLHWEANIFPIVLDTLTGTQNLYTRFRFVSDDWYTDHLGSFIFQQLQERQTKTSSPSITNVWSSADESYKSNVLVWHIATELLYTTNNNKVKGYEHCKFSKNLSDYMAYLLFMKPHFFPKSRLNPLEDNEAAAAARRYIQEIIVRFEGDTPNDCLRRCCQELLQRQSSKNFENKDILSHAISKANELNGRYENDKLALWREISQTWVDILLYAAVKYDKNEHLRGLCEGGELVTIVWLLAFHLGVFATHKEISSLQLHSNV